MLTKARNRVVIGERECTLCRAPVVVWNYFRLYYKLGVVQRTQQFVLMKATILDNEGKIL